MGVLMGLSRTLPWTEWRKNTKSQNNESLRILTKVKISSWNNLSLAQNCPLNSCVTGDDLREHCRFTPKFSTCNAVGYARWRQHIDRHVSASKRCQSYFSTFKCLVMILVKLPVNIMNHMFAEETAGNISFSSTITMTVGHGQNTKWLWCYHQN